MVKSSRNNRGPTEVIDPISFKTSTELPGKRNEVINLSEKSAQYAIFIYHGGMSDKKERAVQTYLAFLEDPKALDRVLTEELENQFSSADSPIKKLRLLAEIDKVRTAKRAALEADFILHAKSWATENDIPWHAFLSLGVAHDTLLQAGFEPPAGAAKGSSKGKGTKQSPAFLNYGNRKPRAKSVSSDAVEQIVLTQTEPFSVRDIVAISHATNATVSRVVGWLVAAGKVESVGILPPQGSRGVSPTGYRVKKTTKK
jgi:hypothetical protein